MLLEAEAVLVLVLARVESGDVPAFRAAQSDKRTRKTDAESQGEKEGRATDERAQATASLHLSTRGDASSSPPSLPAKCEVRSLAYLCSTKEGHETAAGVKNTTARSRRRRRCAG